MVRFVIIGVVIAVAFTLYALVDAAMTDSSRARGVSKPLWVVIVAVLPVVGAILWFTIGRGAPSAPRPKPMAPDDDPRFTGTRLSGAELDAHMRDLEDRLRELDDEIYPGEDRHGVDASEGPRSDASEPSGSPEGSDAPEGSPGTPGSAHGSEPRIDGESPWATDSEAGSKGSGEKGSGGAGREKSESPDTDPESAGPENSDPEITGAKRPDPKGADPQGPGSTNGEGDPRPGGGAAQR